MSKKGKGKIIAEERIYASDILKGLKQGYEKDGKETIEKAKKLAETKAKEKMDRIRKYRTEASRKASMANKRIDRLEKAGLKDSPAYKKYIQDGGQRFGVRGKTHNELQREVARLDKFLNAQTSTIRGVNTQLKDMAKNTGIKYKNLSELREKASKFFELSSKVEQYLRTVDDMATAIGYQKIWTAINKYVENENINLSKSGVDIDSMIESITNALTEYDTKESINLPNGSGWFQLKKE